MKKVVYLSATVLGLILASCASDKKDDPTAPSPSTDARDQYVAYWNVSENSATVGINTHTVNIIKSQTNSNEVLLNNFSNLSVSARASVNGTHLTIPYQQLGSIGFAQGSGTLTTASKIDMTYTTTISGNRDSSIAVYTK